MTNKIMAVVVFLKILLREARVKQSMYIPPKKARSMRVAPIRFTNPAGWYTILTCWAVRIDISI
jgi:hypothetical protein